MVPRPDQPGRGVAADDAAAASGAQAAPVPLAVIGSRHVSIDAYVFDIYTWFVGWRVPALIRPDDACPCIHTHSILLPGGITTPEKFFDTIAAKTQVRAPTPAARAPVLRLCLALRPSRVL